LSVKLTPTVKCCVSLAVHVYTVSLHTSPSTLTVTSLWRTLAIVVFCLLDDQLKLRRVVIDKDQLGYPGPRCLCYSEQSGQMLVGLRSSALVFGVLHY